MIARFTLTLSLILVASAFHDTRSHLQPHGNGNGNFNHGSGNGNFNSGNGNGTFNEGNDNGDHTFGSGHGNWRKGTGRGHGSDWIADTLPGPSGHVHALAVSIEDRDRMLRHSAEPAP